MNRGSAWLAKQLKTHASKTVRYSRGGSHVDLAATLGKTSFEVVGDDTAITRVHSRDYLVTTVDLKIDGIETLPISGDTITETLESGAVEVYRVNAPDGEMPWQYAGQHRHQLRIHTER